jgi:hypothetical protein
LVEASEHGNQNQNQNSNPNTNTNENATIDSNNTSLATANTIEEIAKSSSDEEIAKSPSDDDKGLLMNESKIFCCIDRAFTDSKNHGIAVLRTANVFICDGETGKEHPLRIPIARSNSDLPDGYTDNLVCKNCVDRNRAMGIFFR